MMLEFTLMMYAIAKNVANPARISVKKYVPLRSLGWSWMSACHCRLSGANDTHVRFLPNGSIFQRQSSRRPHWRCVPSWSSPYWNFVAGFRGPWRMGKNNGIPLLGGEIER